MIFEEGLTISDTLFEELLVEQSDKNYFVLYVDDSPEVRSFRPKGGLPKENVPLVVVSVEQETIKPKKKGGKPRTKWIDVPTTKEVTILRAIEQLKTDVPKPRQEQVTTTLVFALRVRYKATCGFCTDKVMPHRLGVHLKLRHEDVIECEHCEELMRVEHLNYHIEKKHPEVWAQLHPEPPEEEEPVDEPKEEDNDTKPPEEPAVQDPPAEEDPK